MVGKGETLPAADPTESIRQFVQWAQGLRVNERSEAQIFCQELFRAFGHDGLGEAGAELEHRVKGKKVFDGYRRMFNTGTIRLLEG